jgi:hypothetical protein
MSFCMVSFYFCLFFRQSRLRKQTYVLHILVRTLDQ